MSDYGALSSTKEGLRKELIRLTNIEKGSIPGILPKLINKQQFDSLTDLKEYKGDPSGKNTIEDNTNVAVTRSKSRDIVYSMVGRQYLLNAGLNRKILSIKNRQQILEKINELQQ